MPLTHIRIENFKSLKRCDIDLTDLTLLIGANGTGKTNILEALNYFYTNLTENHIDNNIFDINNRFSNQAIITLTFDLTDFVIIAKSNTDIIAELFAESSEKNRYSNYYRAIIALASRNKNKTFSLQLSQTKEHGIRWSENFETRFIIKSLFPFFYVDTRNLDINEWSQVWNVLGELVKVSNNERKSIENKTTSIIDASPETAGKIQQMKSLLDISNLSIKSNTSKEFAKNLAKLYFHGEEIYQSGRRLPYYSAGTNSVKYIELLLRTINEIAKLKMKEPVILFDEPEISLHPNYIDEMSESFLLVDNKLKLLISTHSSRLTKNLLSANKKMNLYNVKLSEHYSHVNLMKKFIQYSSSSKYRVTDDHINSYFSKSILFVEGETELELFANPYVKILFPILKSIDVFKAMSDEPILNIMEPHKTKSGIPYICLIDLDKAISFDAIKKAFSLKRQYFKNTKESLLYRNKKHSSPHLQHIRKRLEQMAQKLHVHYHIPFFSCTDSNFKAFIDLLHSYLLNYKIFTLKTTIEGALINNKTYKFAMEYLKKRISPIVYSKLETFMGSLYTTDRINILRVIFNGKTDLLKSYKQLKPSLDADLSLTLEQSMIGDKTSGWVSEYIADFFNSRIPHTYEQTPKGFRRYLSDNPDECAQFLKDFKYYFPELYELLSIFNV